MKKLLIISLLLLLLQSCNKEDKIIQTIKNDFSLIKESTMELVQNYDTCISIFGNIRYGYDGMKIIKVNICVGDLTKVDSLGFEKTESLLRKGYTIRIDASSYYSIFFENRFIKRTFGVTRYSGWYKHEIRTSPKIVGIVTPNIQILEKIDKDFSIVKIVEHFE